MESIAALAQTILSFALIISVIVFIHEFGHYIIARACGVRVEIFSIGFGREIYGWTNRHGTRWKISLLPLGGYVKMFGDAGAASNADQEKINTMSAEEKAMSFHHKALWQKACIVAAGPVANFLLTIIVFTYFIFTTGLSSTAPVVGEVLPHSAAAVAGLEKGDRIISVDHQKMHRFNDISQSIMLNLGESVEIEYMRGKARHTVTLTPKITKEKDRFGNEHKRPLIGIKSQKLTFNKVGFFPALGYAAQETYSLCRTSLSVLGQMLQGNRSAAELKGPLGIAKMSGEVTQTGSNWHEILRSTLWFIALLSVNLGLVNLFPIPMLDGGHLMYYAVEALRGQPMAEKFQDYGFRVGFLLIASLMVFSLVNDVRQMLL